jgi:hypothetical protein
VNTRHDPVISATVMKSTAVGLGALMENLSELDNGEIEELIRLLRAVTGRLEARVEYKQRQAQPLANSRLPNDGGVRPVAKAGAVLSRWATGRWG